MQIKETFTASFVCNLPTDLQISKSLLSKQQKYSLPFIELISFSDADGPTTHQGIMRLLTNQGLISLFLAACIASLFPSKLPPPRWLSGYNIYICHIDTMHST
jgi:hypothetical protein